MHTSNTFIEPLEARIAPAAIVNGTFNQATLGSPLLVTEGFGLSTDVAGGGSYLLFVEKGEALVYTTDLNQNAEVDPGEITGIAAGNGLRLVLFSDVHGDIVTNLITGSGGDITDSDNDPSNGQDGQVLLNSKIEKIELRSLRAGEVKDTNPADGETVADQNDVDAHLALSSYSIFGNIYAGAGFGASDGGLLISTAGFARQRIVFDGSTGNTIAPASITPQIGSIRVGTAASGQFFSFGTSANTPLSGDNDIHGRLVNFAPGSGVAGADILRVTAVDGAGAPITTTPFNLDTLAAGDGGFGARGGNISNVALGGDMAGGYKVLAGNGAKGPNGGAGGSIVNFSDAGSITSAVVLEAGDGGQGLIGAGGAGGQIILGTTSIAAGLQITTGTGGDGFTAGGAGASLTKATFTTPTTTNPEVLTLVSTTRNILDVPLAEPNASQELVYSIGTTQQVDFDGDGFADAIYSTDQPDQLAVLFGFGDGTFDETRTLFLNGPADPEAIVVADFNSDGVPDIAAASNSVGSYDGISVYLSNGDGTFTDALRSALPSIPTIYEKTALPVRSMAAGDYNGDGIMDLAVVAEYRNIGNEQQRDVVLFLTGDFDAVDSDNNMVITQNETFGNGYFYSNFANGVRPFADIGTKVSTPVISRATAYNAASTHDIVLVGRNGDRTIHVFDNFIPSVVGPTDSAFDLGQVDTNRTAATAQSENNSRTNVTLEDFAIVNADAQGGDTDADVVVLAKAPAEFLVVYEGTGVPNTFTFSSGASGADQAGIKLVDDNSVTGIQNANMVAIVAADADGDAFTDDVGVLYYATNNGSSNVLQVGFAPGFDTAMTVSPAVALPVSVSPLAPDIVAFDKYAPSIANPLLVNYIAAVPFESLGLIHTDGDALGDFFSGIANKFNLTTGDGGNAAVGKGGAAGGIGSTTGAVSITLPASGAFAAAVNLVTGDGGDGFSGGGAGGSAKGIIVRYSDGAAVQSSGVSIITGDGGSAVTGAGGSGGDITGGSIQSGEFFQTGDGGFGSIGGRGGNISGNNVGLGTTPDSAIDLLNNTFDSTVEVYTGNGGDGIRAGGAGGSIVSFTPSFIPISGNVGGFLIYQAGNGGSAVSGGGGKGGSIVNSSPSSTSNNLAGALSVTAGNGGTGTAGGAGGSIVNFKNSSQTDTPTNLTLLAGDGGNGFIGNGGIGGSITDSSAGVIGIADINNPFTYSRIIAGAGGISFGAAGGAGGSIVKVITSAQSAGTVAAAGAGGDGLTAGGNGGSVLNSNITGGTNSPGEKVLIVAGKGGDATASVNGLGGVKGKGGNGGSISGFTQPNGTATIVDLIAGNGGNTPNYGAVDDIAKLLGVGKGGSITSVSVAGTLGVTDTTTPIKSYQDTDGNGTDETSMQAVINDLRNDPTNTLDSGLGNVGLVAGAAGRVQNGAAAFGTNGSVSKISGQGGGAIQGIMSMVAGSVNNIAAIQSIASIVTNSATFQNNTPSDKGVIGTVEYLDPNGNPTNTAVPGGRLIDGAILGKIIPENLRNRPRVFQTA